MTRRSGLGHRMVRLLAACAWAVAVASTPAVHASEPASVFLEELTFVELRERIAAGATTVILPIGGTEQNGPHMVLGKHNVRVRVLAGRIATSLGRAVVAPVLPYVPEGDAIRPTGHMRYTGTITVPARTFEHLLEAAAESFRLHGFRDIVFLGDHGGYQGSIRGVADRLDRAWRRTGVRAHAIAEYYAATETAYAALLRQKGYGDREIGTHAGLADTSLTLAIDPRLVRSDRLATVIPDRDGVAGDPRRATAELGQAGVDAIVDAAVTAIRKAIARH